MCKLGPNIEAYFDLLLDVCGITLKILNHLECSGRQLVAGGCMEFFVEVPTFSLYNWLLDAVWSLHGSPYILSIQLVAGGCMESSWKSLHSLYTVGTGSRSNLVCKKLLMLRAIIKPLDNHSDYWFIYDSNKMKIRYEEHNCALHWEYLFEIYLSYKWKMIKRGKICMFYLFH